MRMKTKTTGADNSASETQAFSPKENYLQPKLVTSAEPFESRYPLEISFEIMDICNLRCRHCYQRFQPRPAKGFMPLAEFESMAGRLTPLIRKAASINFTAVEALYHPRIFDMIDIVLSINRSVNIRINTNGMLLNEARIRELAARGIDSFSVSLDGCTRETVSAIKTGVDFDRVVANMARVKAIGGNEFPYKTIFVAQQKNIHELLEYVGFCHDLGVKEIKVSGLISYADEMANQCLYSFDGMPEIDRIFQQAREKALELGISLFYRNTKLEPIGCGFATYTMFIDQDGQMVPCNLFTRETTLSLLGRQRQTQPIIWGNIRHEDPYEIWTHPTSVDFRKKLQSRKLPAECALCALGHNVIC